MQKELVLGIDYGGKYTGLVVVEQKNPTLSVLILEVKILAYHLFGILTIFLINHFILELFMLTFQVPKGLLLKWMKENL